MADLSGLQRLRLPELDPDAQRLTAAQGRQIVSYLYQLNEQLRYILSNLDEENLSGQINQMIAKSYETSLNYGDTYYYTGGSGGEGGSVRQIVSAVMDYATCSIQCTWDDGSLSWYGFTQDGDGAVTGIYTA